MKRKINIIICFLVTAGFYSCNKYVNQSGTSGGGGTVTNTSDSVSYIKFFNPVDFGNLTVYLNNDSLGSIAPYFPSTYIKTKAGSNIVRIVSPVNPSIDALNVGIDVTGGKYYSCFMYKVGYDWKISLVPDDLTAPPANKANIRVLDFRTQAYFTYVNISVVSPGLDQVSFYKRNFLDHSTYGSNAQFKPVFAGSYNIVVTQDTSITNLAIKKNVALDNGKIYSVIMMTPTAATPAAALSQISLDVEKHN
ncbi:MAG: DUF4397 domain-containing protein [Bacteroidota bacterium]|nr:DUF4397 domain-containing protein [Bacteroidota bacterium]